jgi:hypothetical protein
MFGPGNQIAVAHAVSIDAAGNVAVGGNFKMPIDLGEGSLSTGGSFLAGFGPSGAPVWSKAFGASSDLTLVVSDGAGGVVAGGTFTGTINCGGGPLVNSGGNNAIFVARLDGAGNHLWSKQFGDGSSDAEIGALVNDGANGILLAGTYGGSISFGGPALTPAGGATNGDFVAEIDLGAGGPLWSKGFPSTSNILAGVDGSQNIVIAGSFQSSVDLGGGPLTPAGGMDIFVAGLDPQGNFQWSKSFGSISDDGLSAIAVSPSGGVLMSGIASDTINFGGASQPPNAAFLVVLNGAGNHVWSKSFSGVVEVNGLAADGAAGFLVAGTAIGDVGLGATDIPPNGDGADLMVVKIDPAGNSLWARRAGNSSSASAYGVAVNAGHTAALAGMARTGSVDFGTGPLSCTGVCALAATVGP